MRKLIKNCFTYLFPILFIASIISKDKCFANALSPAPNSTEFSVLIVNSYNPNNLWEQFVLKGIESKLQDVDINIDVEYLDVRTRSDSLYISEFSKLMNLKYENKNIDVVLTLDDEAFNFVRGNLYNDDSIFYKLPIVFTGINSPINLTSEDKLSITGVLEMENNVELINMLLKIHPNSQEINLILDNAIYSNVVKDNILNSTIFYDRPIKINILQDTYIENILMKLKNISNNNQINIIVGDFITTKDSTLLEPKDSIKQLIQTTPSPIYTKSQPYIETGVVGGIVDWGQDHGEALGEIILNLYKGASPIEIPPVVDSLEKIVFDYKVLTKYDINPLRLPENSIYINKHFWNLLLPKWMRIFIWGFTFIIIIIVFFLIYKLITSRRAYIKNKLLLIQSQESERLKNEFIATISHELRTPLNIIINSSKLIKTKLNDPNTSSEYISDKLEFINNNSSRLLRLINNVIDLSKIESTHIKTNFENRNIVEVVENTVMLTIDFARNHGIEITFDTSQEEIYTRIDTIKIERVILNLISNAIKFTPKGGNIYINIQKNESNVIIEVIDNGIGIPKDFIPTIFDRFSQADSSLTRENEGSGLGLSICQGLISLHNGSITVSSKEHVGSTFTITLPIYKNNISPSTPKDDLAYLKEIVKLELSDIKEK